MGGELCPFRPCHEAVPLLARFAQRRCLRFRREAFAQVLQEGSCTLTDLTRLEAETQLCGLASCCHADLDGNPCVERGPVVVMVWEDLLANEAPVAVIGALGEAS